MSHLFIRPDPICTRELCLCLLPESFCSLLRHRHRPSTSSRPRPLLCPSRHGRSSAPGPLRRSSRVPDRTASGPERRPPSSLALACLSSSLLSSPCLHQSVSLCSVFVFLPVKSTHPSRSPSFPFHTRSDEPFYPTDSTPTMRPLAFFLATGLALASIIAKSVASSAFQDQLTATEKSMLDLHGSLSDLSAAAQAGG